MARQADPSTGAANFETLYRQELPTLIALATTMTGSRDVGADLAHEALARAYRDWRTVGCLERPGAWVRRVLINLAIDVHLSPLPSPSPPDQTPVECFAAPRR